MSRFIFYTDFHLAMQVPRNRVDSWSETLIEKLKEVYQTAEELDCDFVVFGGDFFDSHRIYSYDLINAAISVIGSSPVKTYGIVGQHDLYGYNPDTYKTSTYGFLVNLCPQFEIIWEPTIVGDVTLYASHVWDELGDAPTDLAPDTTNILVAHHLLTDEKKPFDVDNTNAFAKRCSFDLVLSGDLHCGFQTHEAEGTLFCNPGSLARRRTNDIGRMPQIAYVECGQKMMPVASMRQLKCGKKGDEVFSEAIIDSVKKAIEEGKDILDEEEVKCSSFVEKLESFEKDSEDIHELVQHAGKELEIREPVLEYLLTKKPEKM